MIKHSWHRRSGKTSAAIMLSWETGLPIYFCGWVPAHVKGKLTNQVSSLKGLRGVVVDNYEVATKEDKAILATMTDVHVFGTFGPDADDYRIADAEQMSYMTKAVSDGLISHDFMLREMNITARR
jgi:hypothetical protein